MSNPAQCPSCGGADLSPFGTVRSSGGYHPRVELPLREKKLIGGSEIAIGLIGRVCARCGHVGFWASPHGIQSLRAQWNDLEWPAPAEEGPDRG